MSLQDLDAGGLDSVSRRRVAREAVFVDEADAKAVACEHGRERRARTAGADDDHVEGLAHRR